MVGDDRIDPLTSALNKRGFQELLRERGSAVGAPFGVAVIDLDAFGRVQKQFGLIIGESIVMAEFFRIKRVLAGEAVLARLGRSAFGLLSGRLDEPEPLTAKLEEIREAVRAPISIAGQTVVQTASIGAAFWVPGGPGADEVFEVADDAMRKAKDCGGDQIEVVSPPRFVFKRSLVGFR